ncbi:hypothetical protein Hdeb2414_s0010g00344481 [Helianthus debilis subsp. tardiflorus]
MYATRSKITDLEAQNATLTKKVEDVEVDKERVEAELKAQVASKDKDLHAKDVEIAELKRRLREQTDKSESLDIDLEAEKMANSILNASELDAAVASLIHASHAVGHHGGYLECAYHVEEAFRQEFDIGHCSVTDQADAALARAEGVYDHLSLPVMDLVTEALKHDDWCARLKTILDPPQTVLLSDKEEESSGDGDGDGEGEGGGDE